MEDIKYPWEEPQEAPPVAEENFDQDTPDEDCPCSKCIFFESILCEICIHQ